MSVEPEALASGLLDTMSEIRRHLATILHIEPGAMSAEEMAIEVAARHRKQVVRIFAGNAKGRDDERAATLNAIRSWAVQPDEAPADVLRKLEEHLSLGAHRGGASW